MYALHLFSAGFILASSLFTAAMLVTPPTSDALIAPIKTSSAGSTIYDVLPSGDVTNGTIQT